MRSPFPDLTIPDGSVFEYLFGDLGDDADRVVLVDGESGAPTTLAELRRQVERLAGALAARGIRPGDVVALHSPNVPEFATALHGILRAGAAATTVNVAADAEELADQLRDSGASLLFTVGALLPQASEAARAAGLAPDRLVLLDGGEGHATLHDLLAEDAPAPDVSLDPATHVAVIPYTSGTTDHPMGACLTHRNLIANVEQMRAVNDASAADVVLASQPFFHIYGLTVLLNLAVKLRAQLVTMSGFDVPRFLSLIERYRCTYVSVAPPVAVVLAKHPLVDEHDLSSVREVFFGGAPLDEGLAAQVEERLDVDVRQGYGLTEASPVTHVVPSDRDDISRGSIGLPVPNTEARLVDLDSGFDVERPLSGASRVGELLVRGPQVMLGYLGDADATRRVLDDDGWLHTGDIARMGEQGEFYVVDRLRELIRVDGEHVAPAELEALLLQHPEIADAAVVGATDDAGREFPKAFVVRARDSALDEQAVLEFVAENADEHKRVRAVAFVDAVPKSASGKILRRHLRGL
ncbi:AMP-binding protein [Herbiconiux sp. SYSU D00978]|uniref:AMP-binding protein n=1 Tax=Herbiconiux sp. SYSU D00978 TaxID=2812562 RepID=UPI0027DE9044|nr:AMP-binding protein [Herbiconiux sp. SYSU D00978]